MPTMMQAPTTTRKPANKKVRKAAKPQERSFVLRCMAYPHQGRYIAECIDLDIVVRADNANAAMRSLMQAIEGHLKVVLGGGIHELTESGQVKGLLPRRSPFSHRARYHWYCLLAAISGSDRNFRVFDCPPDDACPSYV